MAAIKASILRDLGRHDLCLPSVARAHGMNPRQVQRIFEAAGVSFHRFVMDNRLVKARAMLADVRYADWKVATVALECGFGDISHLDRAFRRAFDITPREAPSVRLQASRRRKRVIAQDRHCRQTAAVRGFWCIAGGAEHGA